MPFHDMNLPMGMPICKPCLNKVSEKLQHEPMDSEPSTQLSGVSYHYSESSSKYDDSEELVAPCTSDPITRSSLGTDMLSISSPSTSAHLGLNTLVPSGASAAPAAVQPPFKDQVVPWYRGLGGGVARLAGKQCSAKSVKVVSRAV